MKELEWLGSSKKDLVKFPNDVIQEVGYALYYAQKGDHYHKTKPFKGCGSGVYEIVTEHEKNAYRAVYIVNIGDTVYVYSSQTIFRPYSLPFCTRKSVKIFAIVPLLL